MVTTGDLCRKVVFADAARYQPVGLADYLRLLDWSPEQLARSVNRVCGAGTISPKAPYHWRNGTVPRGRQLRQTVAEIFSESLQQPVAVEDLWPSLNNTGALRAERSSGRASVSFQEIMDIAIEWMLAGDSQAQFHRYATPQTVTGSIAQARVGQLRELERQTGAKVTLGWVLSDLTAVHALLEGESFDPFEESELNRCLSDLACTAAWMLLDQEDLSAAKMYLVKALRIAVRTCEPPVAAHIISCLSYMYMWSGDAKEALRLAQIAGRGIVNLPRGKVHAVIAGRQARAFALLGDVAGTRQSAEEAFSALDNDGDRTPGFDWVTPSVIFGDVGRSWLDADQPHIAQHHLEAALSSARPLSRLLHLTSLAEAYLAQQDADGASEQAREALALQRRIKSGRAEDRLRQLRRRLATNRAASAVDAVARLDEHFASDG